MSDGIWMQSEDRLFSTSPVSGRGCGYRSSRRWFSAQAFVRCAVCWCAYPVARWAVGSTRGRGVHHSVRSQEATLSVSSTSWMNMFVNMGFGEHNVSALCVPGVPTPVLANAMFRLLISPPYVARGPRLYTPVPTCPDHSSSHSGRWTLRASHQTPLELLPGTVASRHGFGVCSVCSRVLALRFNGRRPSLSGFRCGCSNQCSRQTST